MRMQCLRVGSFFCCFIQGSESKSIVKKVDFWVVVVVRGLGCLGVKVSFFGGWEGGQFFRVIVFIYQFIQLINIR